MNTMNRSDRLRNWLNRVSETGLTLIGIGSLIVSVLLALKLLQPLGVTATWIENLLLGLVSLLLTAVSIERAKILRPIQSAISLESGAALARKLDSILTTAESTASLASGTALAQKLDSIEAITSQANHLREMGVYAFYPNRNALPDFRSLIESVESDLLICGVSADTMIQAYGMLLKARLKKGVRIRFLLPDRRLMTNEKAIAHVAPRIEAQRTPDHLIDAMKYLILLNQEVETENLTGKLEVRLLHFIPPMGFIILDGQKDHARIRVEQYVYRCEAASRPSYEVVPTPKGNDLFSLFRAQFELCWDEAFKWEPSETSSELPYQQQPDSHL